MSPPCHLTIWRRRQDHGSLVVSSNLTSTMKTFLKKSEFPHVKNLANHSPWVPRDCKELRSRHVRPHTKTKNPAVEREGYDGGWSCHSAFFVSPPRHTGGTLQVLSDGLPFYSSVCVSFNCFLRVFLAS